ncbi:MAG: thiol-disulfide oxidoreductase DCC family protein [Haloferacaceae archaeon]
MSAPRIVYDDDCGFCTWAAAVAARHGEFELVGFSELTPDQTARLPESWERCVHLLTDEAVYSCGKAVEQVLGRFGPRWRGLIRLISRLPGYRRFRERLYHWGAANREWWGKIVSRECT